MRKLFLKDQLRCGQFTSAECGQINWRMHSNDNSQVKITALQTGDRVKISVTDSGQGIDARFKDKIFDRYFRIPGTEKEGTGLGLAISKEFIEAQGGKITVESKLGHGSTFSIILNCSSLNS